MSISASLAITASTARGTIAQQGHMVVNGAFQTLRALGRAWKDIIALSRVIYQLSASVGVQQSSVLMDLETPLL